ncbi:histidinol dehydrogenase [Owenweeksia hongkongensis]|uniref:histidinol dehydrogenase n=1 Tax=Owenweeksia hongkongensis TaxID=253245 RepID=UPI003A8D632D
MELINYSEKQDWYNLVSRPSLGTADLDEVVNSILTKVKTSGDHALFELLEKYDQVSLDSLSVSSSEFSDAEGGVSEELKNAIQVAKGNIEKFHAAQRFSLQKIETSPGVVCWQKQVPIQKVGLYIPGGSAPLFSTLLMLGIPAKLAGCPEIVVCTPPNKNGKIHPATLYTASLLGIKKVFKIGGAQAIAAMAYGTSSIPKVNKIFGPGNQFVTKAKELVQTKGVAIDMPAGPSEVLVIADDSARPDFVAADLLSQAEHGPDSQVILLSTSKDVVANVLNEIEKQLDALPRMEVTQKALQNSKAIVLKNLKDCIAFSNLYAPEHLILACENPSNLAEAVTNAGSVFIGNYSCESAGDYASGTNHTLPTNGFAESYSGVSLSSFTKYISFQEISKEGLDGIGNAIEIMAEAEGLQAHKNAVTIRTSKS